MKQGRQELTESEKEQRELCNVVRKAARTDKEDWLQGKCQDIESVNGDNEGRQAYKLIQLINCSWKSKRSAIKEKNGKMLQGKEEVKARGTAYCSSLYTDSGNSETVIAELH